MISRRSFATNSHDIFNVVSFLRLGGGAYKATPRLFKCLITLRNTPNFFCLQHRHEPHNNWDTEFDFTDANYERVGAADRHLSNVHLMVCKLLSDNMPVVAAGPAGCGDHFPLPLQLQGLRRHPAAGPGAAAECGVAEPGSHEPGGQGARHAGDTGV